MNLEEIRAAKAELESDLVKILNDRFAAFSKATGLPVTGITPSICTIQSMGQRIGNAEVMSVRVNVETGL